MAQAQSRQGNFAAGSQGPMETSSLQASSAKINSRPRNFQANGVNQPIGVSTTNGNSSVDAMRQDPRQTAPNTNQLPGTNGTSPNTRAQLDQAIQTTVIT